MPGWSVVGRVAAVAAALLCVASLPVAATAATTPTVTFSFVGDTILGNTPHLPAQPVRYLAPIAKNLADNTDIVFGNLEGTFTTATTGKCGSSSSGYCYQFRNPPSFARAYATTGFDVLGLANNHSYDYRSAGLRSTKTAISDAGMHYTGLPGEITYLTRHSVRVAIVAFAPYALTNNLLDLSTATKLIRRAHAHASVVVVYMHAGAEGAAYDHVTGREEYYAGEDRGNPRRFAHLAIDNGASMVVASGPHTLRGMEIYKRHLIAYSLGDFANFGNFSAAGSLARSAILHVTLTSRGVFTAATLTTVRLSRGGRAALGGDSVAFVASLSRHDFGAAAPRFGATGRITPR